jgi:hypothetical protein
MHPPADDHAKRRANAGSGKDLAEGAQEARYQFIVMIEQANGGQDFGGRGRNEAADHSHAPNNTAKNAMRAMIGGGLRMDVIMKGKGPA